MTIRELATLARARSGLSQESLGAAAGWDKAHVSKFEGGTRDASATKIDAWLDACGLDLALVPKGPAADPHELDALPEDLRELILRLVRLLPRLPDDHVLTLRGLVQLWTETADQSAAPTTQDKRASIS